MKDVRLALRYHLRGLPVYFRRIDRLSSRKNRNLDRLIIRAEQRYRVTPLPS